MNRMRRRRWAVMFGGGATSPLLAYDSFGVDDANVSETQDALGNTCPARNWTGANYTNAGGKCTVAPTETVLMSGATANGNMETGDPPTGFTAGPGTLLDSAADERTGGAGAASLDIARNGNNYPLAYKSFLTGISAGMWFRAAGWAKRVNTNTAYQQVTDKLGNNALASIGSAGYNSIAWGQSVGVGRATDTGLRYYCVCEAASLADGTHSRFDDLFLALLDTTSMMRIMDVGSADGIIGVDLVVQSNSMSSLVARVSGTTYLHLYYSTGKVYLDSYAAGVKTPITNVSVTYTPGVRLAMRLVGTLAQIYWGGSQIGINQTVPVSVATVHGLMGSYNLNPFDNFAVYREGSGLGF